MIKKLSIPLFFVLFAAVSLTSCLNPVESFLKRLHKMVEDTRANQDQFTENEWEANDAEFEKIVKVDYPKVKKDLTPDQKKEVNELISEYYGIRVRHAMGDGLDLFRNIGSAASSFLGEVVDDVKNVDLDQELEELGEEIDDVVGQISSLFETK